MESLDPEWKSRPVRFVTFPAPPVLAKGVIYFDDAWRSDTLERGVELFSQDRFQGISGAMTSRGPAFVIECPLDALVDVNLFRQRAEIPLSTYCATMSYFTLFEDRTTYSTDVVLEGVRLISNSCHPGSHSAIPQSPWFTLMIQLQRASAVNPSYEIADHLEAESLFPGIDFSMNRRIDNLFKYATVSAMLDGKPSSRISPVLSAELLSSQMALLESNQALWEKSLGDRQRFINLVDRRDEILSQGV